MRGIEDLIGRAVDIAAIPELVVDHPLVTLHGPGGLGKTTLATTMARELMSEFPGGVHVVELAGADGDDDVDHVAARQLGVDTLDALVLRAAGNPTLVVLDKNICCNTTICLVVGDSEKYDTIIMDVVNLFGNFSNSSPAQSLSIRCRWNNRVLNCWTSGLECGNLNRIIVLVSTSSLCLGAGVDEALPCDSRCVP